MIFYQIFSLYHILTTISQQNEKKRLYLMNKNLGYIYLILKLHLILNLNIQTLSTQLQQYRKSVFTLTIVYGNGSQVTFIFVPIRDMCSIWNYQVGIKLNSLSRFQVIHGFAKKNFNYSSQRCWQMYAFKKNWFSESYIRFYLYLLSLGIS